VSVEMIIEGFKFRITCTIFRFLISAENWGTVNLIFGATSWGAALQTGTGSAVAIIRDPVINIPVNANLHRRPGLRTLVVVVVVIVTTCQLGSTTSTKAAASTLFSSHQLD
jgi:hypothetical protein